MTLWLVLSVLHFIVSCLSWTCHWAFVGAVFCVFYAVPFLNMALGTSLS